MSHRTAAQRRVATANRVMPRLLAEAAGRRELREGDVVEVTHFFPSGDPVVYRAIVHFEGAICELEQIALDVARRLKVQQTFYATYPLDGFRDWFVISAIPVNLSQAACQIKMTIGHLMKMNARSVDRA